MYTLAYFQPWKRALEYFMKTSPSALIIVPTDFEESYIVCRNYGRLSLVIINRRFHKALDVILKKCVLCHRLHLAMIVSTLCHTNGHCTSLLRIRLCSLFLLKTLSEIPLFLV